MQVIVRFFCFASIFLVGFLVALHNLYWYFSPSIISESFMPTTNDYNTAIASPAVINFGE